MSKQYKEEKAKLAAIEKAMLSGAFNEAGRLYQELENPLLTARILGIAGRFCGVDMVRTLVENGASFGYERQYCDSCFYTYHYSLVLPDFFILFLLKGVDQIKGYTPTRKMNALVDKEGRPLLPISEAERIQVIEYLCEQEKKLCLSSGDYLYYAILTEEKVIADALRGRGIGFSDEIKEMLTKGDGNESDRWALYWNLFGALRDDALKDAILALHREIGEEKRLHFTEKLWQVNRERFLRPEFFASLLQHFNQSEMNKKKILREIIDSESASCLKVAEDYGWLKDTRRRDEAIVYASENCKIESAAWLLEFKNRTADLEDERKKAEKKLMRELNLAPDSVTALKKLWKYQKKQDKTLIITGYKGREVEVTIPERIGKSIVTAIKQGAFAGVNMSYMARQEQVTQHRKITKITLPKTLKKIEGYAFCNLPLLEKISIPDSVEEIGNNAFYQCSKLVIFCPKGSKAEDYCKRRNFLFQYSAE